jgi:DNA-directed RNA polymerase specialized sigma24 family protein
VGGVCVADGGPPLLAAGGVEQPPLHQRSLEAGHVRAGRIELALLDRLGDRDGDAGRQAGARRDRPAAAREALAVASQRNLDVEALDEALEVLHGLNERHARVVEQRLFAGMTIEESAAALGVSRGSSSR